ncbi:MAG: hypothetical protein AAB507_00635 [Patescibacteria group bacterium]
MEVEKKVWFKAKSNQDDLIALGRLGTPGLARPQKMWFRARLYGWGWRPVTWQGFLITLIYALGVGFTFVRAYANTISISNFFFWFLPSFIVVTLFFLFICYTKGEKPGWHWGNISHKPHP